MDLAKKLQIRDGQSAYIRNAPEGFVLDLPKGSRPVDSAEKADLVLVFVKDSSELDDRAKRFLAAARRDALAYITYPKAGKLGTDLNRDILWWNVKEDGLRGVRQVSIDDVWSAMRFRPA